MIPQGQRLLLTPPFPSLHQLGHNLAHCLLSVLGPHQTSSFHFKAYECSVLWSEMEHPERFTLLLSFIIPASSQLSPLQEGFPQPCPTATSYHHKTVTMVFFKKYFLKLPSFMHLLICSICLFVTCLPPLSRIQRLLWPEPLSGWLIALSSGPDVAVSHISVSFMYSVLSLYLEYKLHRDRGDISWLNCVFKCPLE